MDFDNKKGDVEDVFNQFRNIPVVKPILDNLPVEKTQSGGFHIYYKCALIAGNQKLAQYEATGVDGKVKPETIIETRGEGGFVVCAPSEGYCLIQGSFSNIPVITEEEREILLSYAKSFNSFFKLVEDNRLASGKTNKETPWCHYNNSTESLNEVKELLKSKG